MEPTKPRCMACCRRAVDSPACLVRDNRGLIVSSGVGACWRLTQA